MSTIISGTTPLISLDTSVSPGWASSASGWSIADSNATPWEETSHKRRQLLSESTASIGCRLASTMHIHHASMFLKLGFV